MVAAVMLLDQSFHSDIPSMAKVVFTVAAAGSFVASCIFSWPLKKVIRDGETLLVSDYFQDIEIPVDNIARMEESYAFRRRRIILHLKEPNHFGRKIIFIPKSNFDPSQLIGLTSVEQINVIKEKKTLPEALRAYWPYLIGIAFFPFIAFIGTTSFQLSFEYLTLLFFAFSFLATWPVLSGKAPYAFWIAAMIVFMTGGILAAILTQILKSIAG